jgi:cation diffusion facilitator family transporter
VTHTTDEAVIRLPGPDSRDTTNRARAMRAIAVSSVGLLLTSTLELTVVVFSGSVALLADGLHNLGDVFTTVGVYFGFRTSRKPPTRRYPYGYGRAEDLAGILIVAAIWGSAVLAGIQSFEKLLSGRGTSHLTLGMVAAVIGIVGNQLVARYKMRVGRAIKSAPLIVDARHSRLDAIASFGALIGLIGVALGFRQADPLAGFAITVLIVHIGFDATRDVVARLMDVHDDEVAGEVASIARAIPGVRSLGELRVRWLGRQAEVRLVIHVSPTMPITEAHELAHRVQSRLRAELPDAREIMVEPAPSPSDEGGLAKTVG